MSSKVFTSKFRILQTPLKASDLYPDEIVVATDAIDAMLFTFMENGKETLYDATECPEGAAAIRLSPYKEIKESK